MPKTSRRFAAAEAAAPVGYTPPANPEAEQSVLGAILVRPEVMDRIADVIVPEDFYREAHGRIYQAMLDLYGRGEPVDLVTVSALLKERGQVGGGGGAGVSGRPQRTGGVRHQRRILCQPGARQVGVAPPAGLHPGDRRRLPGPGGERRRVPGPRRTPDLPGGRIQGAPGLFAPERPGGHRDRHPGGHLGPERRLPHRGDQRLHRPGQLHRRVPEQRPDHPGGPPQHGQDRPGPEHRL